MSATVLYMSVSLDGFIAGPNARMGNGLGDCAERLHEWSFDGQIFAISAGLLDPGPHQHLRALGVASGPRDLPQQRP